MSSTSNHPSQSILNRVYDDTNNILAVQELPAIPTRLNTATASIGTAVQTVGTGLNDLTSGGLSTALVDHTFTVVDTGLASAVIGAATQTIGSGLSDATSGGTYTGVSGDPTYTVAISSGTYSRGTLSFTGSGLNDAVATGSYTGADNPSIPSDTYTTKITGFTSTTGVVSFTGSGINDATSGGTYTGTDSPSAAHTYLITLMDFTSTRSATAFTGSGLNDATSSGVYSGTDNPSANHIYTATISTKSTTDKFTWSVDGGAASAEISLVAGTPILLEKGVYITFAASTGHALHDSWATTITCTDRFQWKKDSGSNSASIAITGSAQVLELGVSITFATTKGHTQTNTWAIPISCVDKFQWRKGSGAWSADTPVTGAYQSLSNGISIKLPALFGHKLNDQWAIPITCIDNFQWKKGTGSYSAETPITATVPQTLTDGVTITFAAGAGHTLTNAWTISVNGTDQFKWKLDSGAYSGNVTVTGASQSLSNGVTITWGATEGHTSNDTWTVTVPAGTVIKATSGVLDKIIVNGTGTVPKLRIYDGTSTSGTLLYTTDSLTAGIIHFNLLCASGIYVVLYDSGSYPDIIVGWN